MHTMLIVCITARIIRMRCRLRTREFVIECQRPERKLVWTEINWLLEHRALRSNCCSSNKKNIWTRTRLQTKLLFYIKMYCKKQREALLTTTYVGDTYIATSWIFFSHPGTWGFGCSSVPPNASAAAHQPDRPAYSDSGAVQQRSSGIQKSYTYSGGISRPLLSLQLLKVSRPATSPGQCPNPNYIYMRKRDVWNLGMTTKCPRSWD